MADHLPDDPTTWPHDPFGVLGVLPPVSEADLKRAYTRLIRRFKPEHFPEQFRRVREAYESALERSKWYSYFTPEVVAAPPVTESPEAEPSSRESHTETSPRNEAELDAPRPRPRDPEDEAWALVTSGQNAEAYSRLIELAQARPTDAEIPLRLYWLLAVHPSLDPDRTRHDWLAAALIRSRLVGPSVELYQRELVANADVALFGSYFRILETDANGINLLLLARMRLNAAGSRQSWNVVNNDLELLATRSASLDEVAWLSYLVGTVGFLGFEFPEAMYRRCRELMAGLEHLELREGWAFDQLEEQSAIAHCWKDADSVPSAVWEVVRVAWSAPDGWRKAMALAAEWASSDPVTALRQFDRAKSLDDWPTILATFERLLAECRRELPPYSPNVVRGLVRELASRIHGKYSSLRMEVLRLILAEAIDPEELVQACLVDASRRVRELAARVRDDVSLRLTWRAAMAVR